MFLHYCDDASFSGDAPLPVPVPGQNRLLYFAGGRIHDAVVNDLLLSRGEGLFNEMHGCISGYRNSLSLISGSFGPSLLIRPC